MMPSTLRPRRFTPLRLTPPPSRRPIPGTILPMRHRCRVGTMPKPLRPASTGSNRHMPSSWSALGRPYVHTLSTLSDSPRRRNTTTLPMSIDVPTAFHKGRSHAELMCLLIIWVFRTGLTVRALNIYWAMKA